MNESESVDGIALWRQVAQAIEADVRSGGCAPGDRLPTEAEFARRFRVNRHTIRRAVSELAAAGLLRTEQGRGTFVQEAVIDYPVGRRTRFTETLERQARAPGRELLRASVLPAEQRIAEQLELASGEPLELLELMSKADGRALSLSAHYFPAARFTGIGAAFESLGTVSEALRRFGVECYTRRSTRVTARTADGNEQRMLGLSRYRPMLVTESVNVDASGVPIEFGMARFAADRVQLVLEQ